MPSDSRIDIELPSKCLKCRAAWTVTDHIEAGAQFHSRQRVEKMLEALLIVETPDEQEARTVAGSPRRKKICCDRHRSDLWMSARHQRLGFLLEPARNGRDSSGVFEHVSKQWLGDSDRAREANVSAVQRGHEWNVSQPTDPRANYTIRKPPVRVHHLRLKVSLRPDGMHEVRSKK